LPSLKRLYGDGLQLKVTLESSTEPAAAERFIRTHICASVQTVTSTTQRKQIYIIPRHEQVSLPEIFRVMEEQASRAGIREWSLTQTSLEDVFVNLVTAASNDTETEIELDK